MSAVILVALLLTTSLCCGWERPDLGTGWSSRLVEWSNSSGVKVDCDWPAERRLTLSNDGHADGPVADGSKSSDGIALSWLDSNRQPVVSIPGLRHVLNNGSLHFPPYRGDAYRPEVHSAEYRCLASSSSGALLSPPIIIRSAVGGSLQVYASDAYTLPGNAVVIPCLILPSDQAWAIQVTHWTAGSNHLVDSHLTPQAGSKYAVIDGHLHVSDVTAEDTVLAYRCFARHRLNTQQQRPVSSPPAKIILSNQQPLPMAPQLVPDPIQSATRLRIRHARIGQDQVYMTCTVVAYPPAKIRWFKISQINGAAVALATDGRRITTTGDWLRIRGVTAEDSGRYRCQATNSQGQLECEFRLETHGPLRVRLEPQRQIVGVNQPVELTCNVTGLAAGQVPSIRWTRNGQNIALDVGRFYCPQVNVLRINQAGLADSGMYQCFVRIDTSGQAIQQASSQAQAGAELMVRDLPSRLTGLFNEQTVHPGRPVYLQCISSGIPVPSVVWTVDSLVVPYTSGRVSTWSHQVDDNEMKSYLNISSAEVEDGGLYCCSLQGLSSAQLEHEAKSSMQHCARLNVYGLASIRWAGNKTAVANQDYLLHCPFAGYPILSVTWHRAGQIIRETDKYKTYNNGTLKISSVDPASDSGEYTCLVRGSASSAAKRSLYIEIIRPPVIEPFSFPGQVQDGGRAQVTCSISSGDLPIQVSWMRDGRPISSHLNVEMQTGEFHSLLIFKKLRGQHSGVYTCTARNTAAVASHSAPLLVQVPPKWIVEPQDLSLLENHPATIPCQVHGMPIPNLKWFRIEGDNSIPVHPTNKISLLGDGSLRFARLAKSDEGLFQCRASNNIGTSLSKTIRITVNAGAKVRIHASGAILPTGSETVLRCEASGDPPLTVHWRRLDQLVDEMDRFQLTMTPSGQSQFLDLNISRVEAEDGGVYICQAANIYGNDAAEIRLIVQELPKAPGQLQLTSVQSRSAELKWLDDDMDPLLEYRVQLTRPNTGWNYNHTIEAGKSLITLPHLHPFTSYVVQVNAVNSAGIGPPSTPLEFQTHEEAPTGTVRHVQAEPKSPRSAIVSWLPPNEESWNGRLVTFTVTCLENGSGQMIQRSVAYPPDSRTIRRVQVAVDDLRPATGYTTTVRALNRMGVGPESEPVSFTTPEAAPSSAPVNLQCVSLSSDAIQVTWAHPAPAHHHGHLQGFRIFYKVVPVAGRRIFTSDDVSTFRPESKKVGNVLDSILYGLQAFHNYSIQISALNRAGSGPLSVSIVCQTDEKGPAMIQELKAVSLSGSSILLSWRRATPHSGRIAHYIIQVKDTATQETKKFVQHEADFLDYQVGNLVENRLYEISVTAKGRMGESRPSRILTVAPTSKSGVKILEFSRAIFIEEQHSDVILTCPTVGTLPIEKSWTFAGQPLDTHPHMSYRWAKDGALHLLEVDNNSEGEYSCMARNSHGRDAVVFTLHLLRVPEVPQLSATPTSISSIRLWWNKPSGSGGRLPVQEYVVYYRPAYSGMAVQERLVDGNEDGVVLDGLLCGTQYELQVQARNHIGPGLKSSILRAMTRGSGPTIPESSSLFGFTAGMPSTLFLHLDHWPTGGCRISSIQVEKRGPVSLMGSDQSGWNALASNLNPDEQPMLKMSDFIHEESYHLRLTAASDAGIQTVTYNIRRMSVKRVENGSLFDVVPMMSTGGQSISYESLIVIASMSISGLMLLFSLVAISYVIHKRKQYQASAVGAASTKSEYSLRTVAEQLDVDNQPFNHGRSLGRSNGIAGSNYSLRKPVETTPVDYDDDITPYATFTLKPISGMDTSRSLMSVPSVRGGADSYSSNSIEADVYGQHPTLPCMTMQPPPPPPLTHPAHVYRHLNRSPVPPYRPSDTNGDVLYGERGYTNKKHSSGSIGRTRKPNRSTPSNISRTTTAMDLVTRPGRPLTEFYRHDDDVNKFRF